MLYFWLIIYIFVLIIYRQSTCAYVSYILVILYCAKIKKKNQHEALLEGRNCTNWESEGWHNHFQTLMGRCRPTVYTFVTKLHEKQTQTEEKLDAISIEKDCQNC